MQAEHDDMERGEGVNRPADEHNAYPPHDPACLLFGHSFDFNRLADATDRQEMFSLKPVTRGVPSINPMQVQKVQVP